MHLYFKLTIMMLMLVILFICRDGFSENDPEQQKKINEAIDKGVNFLLKKGPKGRESELVVLTLLHAGVDPKENSVLSQGITQIVNATTKETYRVAVALMVLEMVDRQKYQSKIADLAQALVSSQCQNGQWDYQSKPDPATRLIIGKEPAELIEVITGTDASADKTVSSSGKQALKKIIVKRGEHKRPKNGDNSNTQFALLGLRSAARSGVVIPEETWKDAANFLEKNQLSSGGWTYDGKMGPNGPRVPYGSMTCACICGLAIAKFYLKEDIQNNQSIQKGLSWLSGNLVFNQNPGEANFFLMDNNWWHYYYIYGVERVGAVLNTNQIGNHQWYEEGVQYLLQAQNAKDGSWNNTTDAGSNIILDTCFALLFLKKATPKLKLKTVETGSK